MSRVIVETSPRFDAAMDPEELPSRIPPLNGRAEPARAEFFRVGAPVLPRP